MQASLLYYRHSGDARSTAYDRGEAGINWLYRDTLTFGVSAIRLIGAGDRTRLRGEWNAVPAEDKAACLDKMVAYSGTYHFEEDRVLHEVDTCWIPNWEGRNLVRQVSYPQDNQLLLSTVPGTTARPAPAQRVLWERVQ